MMDRKFSFAALGRRATPSKLGMGRGIATAAICLGIVGSAHAVPSPTLTFPDDYSLNNCNELVADGTNARVYYGDNLSAAALCQFITPPDNSIVANEVNVNGIMFFGVSNWAFAGVEQLDTPEQLTGTWTIPAGFLDFELYDYMITFKDGSDAGLISFLLNEEASSGNWRTPFTNPPFTGIGADQSKANSHFSIFRTTDKPFEPEGPPLPEPGVLFLMGAGLLGFGVARRRKSA